MLSNKFVEAIKAKIQVPEEKRKDAEQLAKIANTFTANVIEWKVFGLDELMNKE